MIFHLLLAKETLEDIRSFAQRVLTNCCPWPTIE